MEGRLVWQKKHKKKKTKEKKEKLKRKKTRGFVLTRPKKPDYPKKIFLSVPWKLTKNISFESQLNTSATRPAFLQKGHQIKLHLIKKTIPRVIEVMDKMTGSLNITLLKTDLLTQLILIGLKCDYDNDDDDDMTMTPIGPGTSRSVCLTSGLVCVISVSSLRLLRRMFTESKMVLGSASLKKASSTVILLINLLQSWWWLHLGHVDACSTGFWGCILCFWGWALVSWMGYLTSLSGGEACLGLGYLSLARGVLVAVGWYSA